MLPLLLLPSLLSSPVSFLLLSPFPSLFHTVFSHLHPQRMSQTLHLFSTSPRAAICGKKQKLGFQVQSLTLSICAKCAEAHFWLRSLAGFRVVSANRLHHRLKSCWMFDFGLSAELRTLWFSPVHHAFPFITYVTRREQVLTFQPGDRERCQLLFLQYGLLQGAFD